MQEVNAVPIKAEATIENEQKSSAKDTRKAQF